MFVMKFVIAWSVLLLMFLVQHVQAELTGSNLVFSEVLFKPSGGRRFEFIEIYNPTNRVIDTSGYKVCNIGGDCTELAGSLNVDSYYVLCSDISTNLFCRQGTTLQLSSLTQLLLFRGNTQVDAVTFPNSIPVGSSYLRGSVSSNLLTFAISSIPTAGVGLLGGATETASPSVSPINVPGITYLGLNELSTISNNRFIEIAFASTKSISHYLVTFYDSDGAVLSSNPLSSFTLGTANNGLIFAYLPFSHSNANLGVALTGDGFIWDFISKGGSTIKAAAGPANGATSINLGTAAVYQQRGSGCELGAFDWVNAGTSTTKGNVNTNQFPSCDVVVFINEIRIRGDSGNYLEVAFAAGVSTGDLAAFTVELYSRSSRTPFESFSLDKFTIGSTSNGLTFASISLDVTTRRSLFLRRSLASLSFEGFSLSNTETGQNLEFYSILGPTFKAAGGGANGVISSDFAVSSAGGLVFGGYVGTGCASTDFAFGADGKTKGAKNTDQTITCSSSSGGSTPAQTNVLTIAPTTAAPTPAPTPFPTPAPTQNANECTNGQARCSRFATCTDTVAGFTCTCNVGYTGDGFTCIDVDECVVDKPCANPGGFCVDQDGSFKCGCLPGYVGDGLTCTDINECNSDPCGPNAVCTNAVGSFVCACKSGYSGTPYTKDGCSDTNECASSPCGANAFCTNTVGSYVCACNAGFTGNGIICTDVNECTTNKPCDANANCLNTVGGYTCTCKTGYTGSGLTCTLSATPGPTPAPIATPAPNRTPAPNKTPPVDASDPPSSTPTISSEPSISSGPSLTSNPSEVPSLSNEPSRTQSPSLGPSISLSPSITSMPSDVPSLSDAPTR